MVQYKFRFKKGIAIELRKQGLSYGEIENKISIPKSTVAYWVKSIKLNPAQYARLQDRQINAAKKNIAKRNFRILQRDREIERTSINAISNISSRELWLMGLVLYWRENNTKTVNFYSSNPGHIKLFLKWLKDIGHIEEREIRIDIFTLRRRMDEVRYWAKITGFPIKHFSRFYMYQSRGKKPMARKYGLLRIRVRESSMLQRQIKGWIEAIRQLI